MPRLDLVAKNEANSRVVPFKRWQDVLLRSIDLACDPHLVEFVNHLLAVRADIVNIDLDRMAAWLANAVTCESRIESHSCTIDQDL